MEEGRCTVGPSVVQASIGNSKGAKFTIVSRRCKIFIRFVLCPFILPFFLLPFFLDLEIERRAVFSRDENRKYIVTLKYINESSALSNLILIAEYSFYH